MGYCLRKSRKLDALEIREAALALMRRHGRWQHDGCKIGERFIPSFDAKLDGFIISLSTPFSSLPGPSDEIRYLAALQGKELISNPYGLNIWAPRKVLSLQWQGSDDPLIVSFRRGPWEQDLLVRAALLERRFA